MKKILSLLLAAVLCLSLLAACAPEAGTTTTQKPGTTAPTNKPTDPKPTDPKPTEPQPTDPFAGYETITVAKALELAANYVEKPSEERFYIRATIKSVDKADFGQLTIMDETGEIMVYGTYSEDGSVRYDKLEQKPDAGDEILIYGTLQNYKGNTLEVQNARLIAFIDKEPEYNGPDIPADSEITIAEALQIAANFTGDPSPDRYYINATIKSISNPAYGEMTIEDETGEIYVYGTYSADGSIGYADMAEKPYKGDKVKLYVNLNTFKGTPQVKNARLISFEHVEPEYNPDDYVAMSIAAARQAQEGAKLTVTGVVARITYANGFIPSGFYLVDETNSIYVYDRDLAGRVAIGNKVTIAGSKTYWILESEQNNANKFGYKGCSQIESGILLENDNGSHDFDKSWIPTSTVKDIIETPVTEDITTTIFKVNALVKKVNGTGFVNYYFFDLDGTTGSYAYTQCNGNDFAWLDEFDGKICTVYLSAINAKSTADDCYFRLIPVAVADEGFQFDLSKAAEHVVKYYGLGQIEKLYSADPMIKLITSVSSDLLGFTNAKLSYASSDENIIKFIEENGELVMHTVNPGTATITITGSYNGVEYAESFEVTVEKEKVYEFISVGDAINANNNTVVTVQGIVGPSLVNKDGFYLIDETGIIAVRMTKAEMADLKLGNKVIISGTFLRNGEGLGSSKEDTQTKISDATVLVNYYGEHEYATNHFVTDKDFAEFASHKTSDDWTTTAYILTVKLEQVSQYVYALTVGEDTVSLYNSGIKQYSWLAEFVGQEIKVEVIDCNWNSKAEYKVCVLAVYTEDGKIVNQLNFGN